MTRKIKKPKTKLYCRDCALSGHPASFEQDDESIICPKCGGRVVSEIAAQEQLPDGYVFKRKPIVPRKAVSK